MLRRTTAALLAWLGLARLGAQPVAGQESVARGEPASPVFWNPGVIESRTTVLGVSPEERVARALQRLETLPLAAAAVMPKEHWRAAPAGD